MSDDLASAKRAVAVLIAAAGSGQRLGHGPKAFVTVGGRTLLEWSLRAWRGHADELVVAVAAADVDRARALAPDALVISGGASRQDSVMRMLQRATADDVLVHDVARPFLPLRVLEAVRLAARETGAATACLALADTLVDAETARVVPRERLRAVQTPQGFHRELLWEAHAKAASEGVSATDDAALVRRLGHAVALVEGSPLLHKVTVDEDLLVAEALLVAWRAGNDAAA